MRTKYMSEDYDTEEKKFQITRGMVILAAIILVILIVIITLVISLVNRNKPKYTTSDFKYLENRMEEEAPTYLSQKGMEISSNVIKIDLKDLLTTNGGFINPKNVKAANICVGYVDAYKDEEDGINYKPYIKCEKYYTTDGYKEEKIETTTTIKDTEKPSITLNGEKEITIEVGSKYNELGATAIDNVDKDITSKIKIEGSVDTNSVGTYKITYKATDATGNMAEEFRTINVIEKEVPTTKVANTTAKTSSSNTTKKQTQKATTKIKVTTPPTLTLNKGTYIEMNVGEVYIDPGYTAVDAKGLNITASVMVTGSINSNVEGTYKINYSVTDAYGNTTIKTRTVKVKSTYIKVKSITVTPNTVSITKGSSITIAVGYNPSNASNKTLYWSSNNSVATVNNGVIKGVSKGVATVTVTSIDGPSKNIPVTVK